MISSLATEIYLADKSNYSNGRSGYSICKITPHHMASVMTAKQCGTVFQSSGRNASANYGIGNDGTIACYVEEENRAWTSSSKSNDCQAITIEVSNSQASGDYPISDAAWNSLVKLCVDICKRYNFKLNYDGTANGSLTRHNMFANTTCPGPYLQSRFQELADTVNIMLSIEELCFDSDLYNTLYEDLQKAFAGNFDKLYAHLQSYGLKEKRTFSYVFDVAYYLNKYEDLQKAFGNNYIAAYEHFINYGIYEGRQASMFFNPVYYLNKYSDLKETFGTNYILALNHFISYGMKEGRQASNEFNVQVYRNTYTDLQKAFGTNYKDYFKHYMQYGKNEKRKCV